MRLSAIIAWVIVILLLFPSSRKAVTTPLLGILVALGAISLGTRNNPRDNQGL